MKRYTRFLIFTASALWLGGCANPSGIFPETLRFDERAIADKTVSYADWPQENWWLDLKDPVLTGLIEQALIDSPSLQAASARLRRAQAMAGATESALWPQLDSSTSNSYERFSARGLIPPPYAGTTQSINDLQVSGQWEIDFFGKNREALRAALGEVRAREVDQQATRQLLATNIARSYYNLARLLAQHDLAQERHQQRLELAKLVEQRFKAGIDTQVELEMAAGVIPENARDIAALDEQISLARHSLAALLGKLPDAADSLAPKLPIVTSLALPQSLPANLLGHRADVVAARWRIEAAIHTMDSTKALFYPDINLSAFTDFSAIGLNQWLTFGSRQPGIGLAISLPIFDAGRLRSLYRVSAADLDTAVASYNNTLLEALQEVADQLTTLRSLDTQRERQQATLDSAKRSYELAMQRYRAEISDRLNVLNAESSLITQRRASIDLHARWIDSRIRLIHALGGGFFDARLPTFTAASIDKTTHHSGALTVAESRHDH